MLCLSRFRLTLYGLLTTLLVTSPEANVAAPPPQAGGAVAAPDAADDPPPPVLRQLRAAHGELLAWLAPSEHGPGWRAYLQTDELERQMALGWRADRRLVHNIAARYAAEQAGLEMPGFQAVRGPLEAWLEDLSLPRWRELP